jgi:hypothetical protein
LLPLSLNPRCRSHPDILECSFAPANLSLLCNQLEARTATRKLSAYGSTQPLSWVHEIWGFTTFAFGTVLDVGDRSKRARELREDRLQTLLHS